MNIREEIDRATRAYIKALPAASIDADLMIDGRDSIGLTLNIYGEPVRAFRGGRDQPEEFAGFEITDVRLGDISIMSELGEDALEMLALKVEE